MIVEAKRQLIRRVVKSGTSSPTPLAPARRNTGTPLVYRTNIFGPGLHDDRQRQSTPTPKEGLTNSPEAITATGGTDKENPVSLFAPLFW